MNNFYKLNGERVRIWIALFINGYERGDIIADFVDRELGDAATVRQEVVGKWAIPSAAVADDKISHQSLMRIIAEERIAYEYEQSLLSRSDEGHES